MTYDITIKRLRKLMDAKGLTNIKELEIKSGLNKDNLRYILKGQIDSPRLDYIEKVAKTLGTTVAYLIGETDEVETISYSCASYEEGTTIFLKTNTNISPWLCEGIIEPAIIKITTNTLFPVVKEGDYILVDQGDYAQAGKLYAFQYNSLIKAGFVSMDLEGQYVVKDGEGMEIGRTDKISFIGIAKRIVKSL